MFNKIKNKLLMFLRWLVIASIFLFILKFFLGFGLYTLVSSLIKFLTHPAIVLLAVLFFFYFLYIQFKKKK